ncbi:MAG: hypothetical protein COA92_00675 [Sulfurovum sp.]|nr:MAG: hypothetical protein COA92_00675 [Sulfurovum sp.]
MTINLFQTAEYKELITDHILKTIAYLFEKQQEFSIACEIKHIQFSPVLPQEIQESFDEVVLFILSGYTYETAKMGDGYISFEAGFGTDNFGSTVSIPLLAIKQMFVGENPIVINLAEHSENKTTAQNAKKISMESLLNNPENKKLLKRKK